VVLVKTDNTNKRNSGDKEMTDIIMCYEYIIGDKSCDSSCENVSKCICRKIGHWERLKNG